VLLLGAVGYGLQQRHLANSRASRLATAEQALRGIAAGARPVALKPGPNGGDSRGLAVQSDGHVWVVADGLPANDRANSTYVLWASSPDGQMTPVTTFDVGKDQVVTLDRLPMPSGAAAVPDFAISHEQGRTAPPSPSTPLLTSQA
jgi:hypothetical protein